MKWILTYKSLIGLLLLVLMLGVNGLVSYRNFAEMNYSDQQATHSLHVVRAMHELALALVDAETGQRGFLITGAPNYLEPYRRAAAQIDAHLRNLRSQVGGNADQTARLNLIESLIRMKMDELGQSIELRQRGGFEATQRMVLTDEGKMAMDRIRREISDFHVEEERLFAARAASAREGMELTLFTFVLANAVSLLLAGYVANLVLKDLNRFRKTEETLRDQALHDDLTGLFNRRYLDAALAQQVARSRRSRLPFSMLILDVDLFKNFNDELGHEAGDAVLRGLGRLLQKVVRGSDIACRYGGEEFVVLLPDTSLVIARQRGQQILEAVRRLEVPFHGSKLRSITVSVGAAAFPEHGSGPSTVLDAADAALYEAKRGGRDRMVVSGEPVAASG